MNCLYEWTDINLVHIGLNLLFLLKNEPTYDEMNKLQYMEQVILESLRMFPPLTR